MQTFHDKNRQVQNFVVYSLGCGPGSEVFGLINSIQKKFPYLCLKYEGFDMNSIWSEVQNMNKEVFRESGPPLIFIVKTYLQRIYLMIILICWS